MVRFIADVGSNHNGSLTRALAFVAAAKRMGCWGVKFQLFHALFADGRTGLVPLPEAWLPRIATECERQRIAFVCTPFDFAAVQSLAPYVDAYKVSSYDLLRTDLLEAIAEIPKPVILGTGMATMDEVREAVNVLGGLIRVVKQDVVLLHCVSAYPADASEANLAAIATMRDALHLPVGWSDHTHDPQVIARAVDRWQADVVEFHLDLDGDGAEYGYGHCWLPAELDVEALTRGHQMDGDGRKVPRPSETPSDRADASDGLRPMKEAR